MKLLKKAIYGIVFTGIGLSTLQIANSQEVSTKNMITFEEPTELSVKPVYFQEWYAGIKVGGTGINVFVPIANESQDIVIDSIYFRNLKGKLTKKDGKYFATLENASKLYTFKKTEKPVDYPFVLEDNECAISYIENGETKYFKVAQLNEVAGTYYENGPPSIYTNSADSGYASTDDDEDLE